MENYYLQDYLDQVDFRQSKHRKRTVTANMEWGITGNGDGGGGGGYFELMKIT